MKRVIYEWFKPSILLFFILVIAGLLRVYHLTIVPVFADEAIYIRWAQVMRAVPSLRFLPLTDGKQPLLMWLIIPFFRIFSDPLVAGRMVSVLSGLGTLAGIGVVGVILFKSKKVALAAALIYAVSPFSLFFNRMALADSLLSFFGIWVFIFGILTARTKRLDFAMLAGFALGGALLTKSTSLFFTLLLPSTMILAGWKKDLRYCGILLAKLILLYSATYIIGYSMYNILQLGPEFRMIAIRNQDYVFPFSHIWTDLRDPFVFYLERSFEWIRSLGPILILVLGGAGAIMNIKKFPKQTLILAGWFMIPILVQSEYAKVYTARYILFTLPYLCILAASGFLTEVKIAKIVLVVLFLSWFFTALRQDYFLLVSPENADLPRSERSGYLEAWTSGYGIKEVADYIRRVNMASPGKQIVVGTEGFFGTLPDGLQIYLNDLPSVTIKGIGIAVYTVNQSLIDSKKAGNKTYLVVNNTRFTGNADSLGLKLLAVYPKPIQPNGEQVTLLFFEVTEKATIPPKPKISLF